MRNCFDVLNGIITEEVQLGHKIVIYPMGKIGMYARIILEKRFDAEGIYVDNNLCMLNHKVISLEKYLEEDSANNAIILCTQSKQLNKEIRKTLEKKAVKAKIRDYLEPIIRHYPQKEEYFKKIKDLCRVMKVIDYQLVRVGGDGDGGYVMINDFDTSSSVYSYGIGEDVTFENWIAKKCNNVYCYDHTIDELPANRSDKLRFIRIGIADTDNLEENVMTLESAVYLNGDLQVDNLLLKMDVEGAEWDVLDNIKNDVLNQFKQITLELHDLTNVIHKDKVIRVLEKLNKTHQVVWVHANNTLGIEKGTKTFLPPLLEITYVRRANYKFVDIHYDAPNSIDKPNNQEMSDVFLDNWGTDDE